MSKNYDPGNKTAFSIFLNITIVFPMPKIGEIAILKKLLKNFFTFYLLGNQGVIYINFDIKNRVFMP